MQAVGAMMDHHYAPARGILLRRFTVVDVRRCEGHAESEQLCCGPC